MRDRRLEELLREPGAHAPEPSAQELRALQDAVLARFAAERASAPRPRKAWIERLALAAGAVAVLIAAAEWLGALWRSADEALEDWLPAAPPGGWASAFADSFAAQPWIWTLVLLGLALLLVRPVRETLLRELR